MTEPVLLGHSAPCSVRPQYFILFTAAKAALDSASH